MRFRSLGSNGPDISVVGFGSWAVGGPYKFGWGPVDDEESIAAIRHAIDRGVNWVDTAAVYGLGHSEEVVGRAVAPYRTGEEVLVFTKCGRRYRSRNEDPTFDLRAESIRAECDESLKRLGIERIDLYQFHWPDTATGTAVEDSWSTMQELVEDGKVRWAGVSNFDVELLARCEKIRHVDSLQPPLSILKPAAREKVIPWCESNRTGVIVYSPMASGLLTGKYDRSSVNDLAEDDWRRGSPDFQEPGLSRNLAVIEGLRPLAAEAGASLAEVAIAWTLSVPGVTGAIAGARRPEQVDGWVGAGDLELSPQVLDQIEDLTAAPELD